MRIAKKDVRTSQQKTIEALGFVSEGESGGQLFGDCDLCGGRKKFYFNPSNGLWDCKRCGEKGNIQSYLEKFRELKLEQYEYELPDLLEQLSINRDIPLTELKRTGIFYDGEHLNIPILNPGGNLSNLRQFKLGNKIKVLGLAGLSAGIGGLESLQKTTKTVVICEGEWDAMALRSKLRRDKEKKQEYISGQIAVVWCPGANVWKHEWSRFFEGMDVVIAYDKDEAGEKGIERLTESLIGERGRKVYKVEWPAELPTGFDIRDFCTSGGTWELLSEMLEQVGNSGQNQEKGSKGKKASRRKKRPSFDEVIEIYRKWLLMTEEHETVLKLIYAIILSNQLSGDPLWMQIVGAPGSGKTEMLMSCSASNEVVVASSVTPHGLVSGFQNHGGKDPSLLAALMGKVFILKDFTEVLQMAKQQRDEVYAILRGAYDGEVTKRFGNGVTREYRGYFSMVAGVTQAVDGDTDSSMGERFLKFRMQGHSKKTRKQVILESLKNVGREHEMKAELQDISQRFLDLEVTPDILPDISLEYLEKIISLSEVVVLLRATVSRDTYHRDRIQYRPQPEVGTRVAKQLKRTMMGLALTSQDFQVSPEDYEIVKKVALHSCIPFHLEILKCLMDEPWQNAESVSKKMNVPLTTLRECFDNLLLLGIVRRRQEEPETRARFGAGRRAFQWAASKDLAEKWKHAEI